MVKIITNLRHIKILLKNSFMNPEINHKILHSKKNIIDLESENEMISDSEGEVESPPALKRSKTFEEISPDFISK